MRFPLSAPRTAPSGRAHALLARGLSLLLLALAALVLASVGHAQSLDPVLVSNTGQTAGSDLATATGRVSYAQSFTTGVHPDGYFLSSVEVGLKAGSGVTAEVALWRSNRTTYGRGTGFHFLPDRILTTLSRVSSIDDDASTLERFSANDVLLLPDTTYWIVVTRTGGADDGLSVATTSSEDAVDAGGMAGFSVGNNVWVPESSLDPHAPEWADYSSSVDASMKIGLRGSEATRPPGPYATNRNEQSRAAAAETSSSTSGYATSFTTASNPATHELTSVLLGVAAESGVSPRVAIHADNGGSPAASAVTNDALTAPADVSRVLGAPDRAEFTASTAIPLDGSTRYWVVLNVGSGSGSLSVSTTADDSEDEISADEWFIGDTMKAYNGSSWSNDSQGRSFRMALNGPTDQYIGPPFERMREVRIGLPQVGVGVAAEIVDSSLRIKNATWQWQRGETSDGTFTDIPAAQGGTSRVYVPDAADLGKWLKALVTYENAFGPGKSLSGVSGNAVLSQPIMSNAGQISDINYGLQRPDTVNVAQAFTTGGNPSGYSLSGLRFGIRIDTVADALSWALHDDNAGEPAAAPLFAEIAVPSDSLDRDNKTFEDLVHPGFPLAPDTKYWAVLTSSPLMEGTEEPTLFLTGISEVGDIVILDGPAAELDPGSASDWTLDFSTLSSPQDPMSTEEWVPYTTALELEGKIVLRMSVLTHPQVTASFGQAAYTVAEGATQSVTVTLSADPERTVTIPIVTTEQDGASNGDYSGVPANVTFNTGETEKSFTFSATQDMYNDDGESVRLSFGTLPPAVRAGTPSEATVSITDDDDPPEVAFDESAYTVSEGGIVSVEVKLAAALESAVTVPIRHTPQGTTSSGDYSGVPVNVTFNTGETEKSFTFSATQDMYNDDGESVRLSFGTLPPAVRAGTPSEATVSITDDDDPPEVAFGESAYTVSEGGIVSVEVKLAAALESAVTVPIRHTPQGTTSSGDYSGVPVNVTFSAGDTSKAFTFSGTQDMVDDDGESVRLSFGTLPPAVRAGTPSETTVSITDDDIPSSVVVSFGSTTYTVTEGGTVDITVILDDDPEQTVTVPIRTINEGGASDSDYSGVPATVTFSSGETEKTFTVTATEDNLEDGGEGVKLSFGTLPPETTPGTTNQATVTIINKAAQNSLTVGFQSVAYSVPEGNSVVVTVILSAAPGSEVTVPLTVTEQGGATSADYSGVPASVTFGPDERDQTFTVSATQDVVDDDEESVVIGFGTLSDGVREGGAGNTTVDIRDDDDPAVVVSFGSATYTVTEGDTVEVTVTLDRDPERTVLIPITKANQGTASDADYSGVPASVVFNSGETEKSITFSRYARTPIDDDGESVRLAFGTLPDRVSAGTTSETVISITDDDVPSVAVSFEQPSYSVPEGGSAVVTVTLSADPERTVLIPITKANQGTASDADYSGVPASVVFNSGETEKSITFSRYRTTPLTTTGRA